MPFTYQTIVEGSEFSVTCYAIPGNPNSTTFFWTKIDHSEFRQNGARLQIPNINRSSSGTYRCTAENTYYNGQKGNHSQHMFVNILCKNNIPLLEFFVFYCFQYFILSQTKNWMNEFHGFTPKLLIFLQINLKQ